MQIKWRKTGANWPRVGREGLGHDDWHHWFQEHSASITQLGRASKSIIIIGSNFASAEGKAHDSCGGLSRAAATRLIFDHWKHQQL